MQPTFFINHGGGPCFFLEPGPMRDEWSELEAYLRGFLENLDERPRAILAPPLLFDYGSFPAHTYQLTWPAPGDPELTTRVRDLLGGAAIESASDMSRGWDHGVFVPLKVMLPHADVPTVQLSLRRGLHPAAHLAIGRALAPLRDEGVLIVGSGQSYHNMRGFTGGGGRGDPAAEAFDAWLRDAVADSATRDRSLAEWGAGTRRPPRAAPRRSPAAANGGRRCRVPANRAESPSTVTCSVSQSQASASDNPLQETLK